MKKINPDELIVCRTLNEHAKFRAVCAAINDPGNPAKLAEAVTGLITCAEDKSFSGNILKAYVVQRLVSDRNLVADVIEKSGGLIGESIQKAYLHDLEMLLPFITEKATDILPGAPSYIDEYEPTNERQLTDASACINAFVNSAKTAEELADGLITYFRSYGYGDMATYRAFAWDSENKSLVGIRHFEPQMLSSIIGYTEQKDALAKNTLAFLSDRPANNVLLVGDRGTGKSTSIKALANEYFRLGLRIVQLTKSQLPEIPHVMEYLRQYGSKHFIIYLDDLSFEANETEYKLIKSAIEGSVEPRPENVLIYATSNRRHLIHESWHDRNEETDDELYNNDSVNETVSLSDRFGLIIKFRAPSQEEYLNIIDHALREGGVFLPPEELKEEGRRWELEHSGRNGRTARQFAAYYLGQRVRRSLGDEKM